MKRLLIISAVVTGLIAPALFAATQYVSYNGQRSSSGEVLQGSTGTSINLSRTQKCLKGVMTEYSINKLKLSQAYKANRTLLLKGTMEGVVSGEKSVRSEKLKSLQKEYILSLNRLKNTTLSDQRTCTKK